MRYDTSTQWIATDQGTILPAQGLQLGRLLGSDLPNSEIIDYCVRNLGFVAIATRNAAHRISFRPKCLSESAAIALGYWLSDQAKLRVICNLIDDSVAHRLFVSPLECLHFVFNQVDRTAQTRTSNFLKRSRDLQMLSVTSPIRRLIDIWHHTPSLELTEGSMRPLNDLVSGRMTIAEPVGDKADLITRYIGDGYKVYDRHWLRVAIGRRYEDGPDPYYGRWVADAQRVVMQNKVPVIEDVDAIFDRPFQSRLRVRYTRVILPFQLGGRRPWLLTASTLAPSIDLRARA